MSAVADSILANLGIVDIERKRRLAVPKLVERVTTLKAYQQRRFARTYADLLATPRYGPAARFFLDELYGPSDFARRDGQFARVVPALVRLFPAETVGETVAALASLHALSETLDSAMAEQLETDAIGALEYLQAWQRTGRATEREQQIALTLDIATRLDALTRRPLLRNSLRLMRGPARAAGLAELQQFLEVGFDTFRAMHGASEFVATIASRERTLASNLFVASFSEGVAGASIKQALDGLP